MPTLLAKEVCILFCIITFRIEEMGCGVAMTVIQTKNLISLEANQASKSLLKTNNVLKTTLSQPSIFRVRETPNRTDRDGQKENITSVPSKASVLPIVQEKAERKENQLPKEDPPQKPQPSPKEPAKVTKTNAVTPSVKAQSKGVVLQDKTQLPKTPAVPQKSVNNQHKPILKQQTKPQPTAKKMSAQSPRNKPIVPVPPTSPKTLPQNKSPAKPEIKTQPQPAKPIQTKQTQPKQTAPPVQSKPTSPRTQIPPQQPEVEKKAQTKQQPMLPIILNAGQKKTQVKPTTDSTSKTELIKIQSIKRKTPPETSQRNNSRANLDKKESEKKLRADVSRKSLKVKKGMVPVDSLFLQSVITKPEEPQIQKQTYVDRKSGQPKEEVSVSIPQGRKSKNEPIQIVDNLAQIDRNLEKSSIPATTLKKMPTKRETAPKIIEENITRITQEKKKIEEERKAELAKRKAQEQKRKAQENKKIQQAKKKIQLQEKKSIEMEASKLKKVYNV